MKRFLAAVQFLTIFPVRVKSGVEDRGLGRSILYFPLVGLLIGLLLAVGAFLFSPLPGFLRAVLILFLSVTVTGGIHLDGFADTCDGFYGSKPKERILEIMRDSRIGAMGVIGLVFLMLLKLGLIIALPQAILGRGLIAMAVFSRWAQVLACSVCCYARGQGKAGVFVENAGKKELFAGLIFTLALFFLLWGLKGLVLFLLSLLPVFLFIRYINKRIAGMTGDTIGALSEVAELAVLFSVFFMG